MCGFSGHLIFSGKPKTGDILSEPCITVNQKRVHLLLHGDGAYPLLPWLMKPFTMIVNLSVTQKHFNRQLSSAKSTLANIAEET